MKICVIGCGIVGTFLSFFLKKRGVDVTALSRARKYPSIGLIQSIMQKHDADIYAARRSREIYIEVSKMFNIDDAVKYVKSYTIIPRSKEDFVDKLVEKWRENNVRVRKLEKDELRDLPFKYYDNEIIYLCDNDTIVRIDKIIEKLWREIGVEKCTVTLVKENDKLKILANGREINNKFDIIAICCGAWTRKILSSIGINIPLIPYKCQAGLFALSTRESDYILYDYVNKIYVRPCGKLSRARLRGERLMVAGNGNTPPMDPEDKARVEPWFANDIIPKLLKRFDKARFIKGSAGFCDTSPDSRPIIGVFNNVLIVSGFDGYGAEIGPAVAEIACKIILKEPLNDLEKSFLVDRFSGEVTLSLPQVEAHEL
ncbi:MAG: FAD-binding oxidoreductase [Crenarchaeota archaeon]|nr:FAD-binding oxidoreductase [Thermoproteota archaeon]